MSTETPWYFNLVSGDKIRVRGIAEEWEVTPDKWGVNAKNGKGAEVFVSSRALWESWEPVPSAPVYPRPDLSDWWCVANINADVKAIFKSQSSADWFSNSNDKVVPYSATTPTAPPEPVVPVAKVREWIDDTIANLRGISFIRNRLNEYLAENPKQEPSP